MCGRCARGVVERQGRLRGRLFDRASAPGSGRTTGQVGLQDRPARHPGPRRAPAGRSRTTGSWARLRDAAARLSDAAKCIIPKALAGMAEREVAAVIEAELRRVGFDKPAFDTIVAAGPNSACRITGPATAVLGDGDLVVMDFGGMLDGYAVDLTRTITVGRPREPGAATARTTWRRRRRRRLTAIAHRHGGHGGGRCGAAGRWRRQGWARRSATARATAWASRVHERPRVWPLAGGPGRRSAAGGNGVHPRAGRVSAGLGWRADRR